MVPAYEIYARLVFFLHIFARVEKTKNVQY